MMINPYAASFLIATRTEHLHDTFREVSKPIRRRRWHAPIAWKRREL